MANIQPITINGYSLDSSASVMAAMTTHDSAPRTDISMVKISRRDGGKIINSQYAEKNITITGQLLLGSQAAFEQVADDFKRNVEVNAGALNIPYASGTRQYNVWTSGVTVTRDSENIEWAPYQIDYVAADPPFGVDLANQTFYSTSNITVTPYSSSVWFGGSAEPKPLITVGVKSGSFLTGLQLNTYSPQTSMALSDSQFSTGNAYQFNTNTYSLNKNGLPYDYSGIWPQFTPNQWNGFTVTTTGTVGYAIDQQQLTSSYNFNIYGPLWWTQTFTPSVAGARTQVDFIMSMGRPSPNQSPITVQIKGLTAGVPNSSVQATATIPVGAVPGGASNNAVVTAVFTSASALVAGTQYAYVVSFPGGYDGEQQLIAWGSPTTQYSGGTALYSIDSGATWINQPSYDLFFRDWYSSGATAQNLNISFQGVNRWL